MPACLLKTEWGPSPNKRPQSVPCIAQKMWTTLASSKVSRPSHWLPISWDFLQVDHYCLSLLFWPSCSGGWGSILEGPHGQGEPRLLPRSLKQEATLAELSTHRSCRWHNDRVEQLPATHLHPHPKINRTFGITAIRRRPFYEVLNVPRDCVKAPATKRTWKLYFLLKKLANGSIFL